jgi:hypothetical protein
MNSQSGFWWRKITMVSVHYIKYPVLPSCFMYVVQWVSSAVPPPVSEWWIVYLVNECLFRFSAMPGILAGHRITGQWDTCRRNTVNYNSVMCSLFTATLTWILSPAIKLASFSQLTLLYWDALCKMYRKILHIQLILLGSYFRKKLSMLIRIYTVWESSVQ